MKRTQSAPSIADWRDQLSVRAGADLAGEPDREHVPGETCERDLDDAGLVLVRTDALLESDPRPVADPLVARHTRASHVAVARGRAVVRVDLDRDVVRVRELHIQSADAALILEARVVRQYALHIIYFNPLQPVSFCKCVKHNFQYFCLMVLLISSYCFLTMF